MNKRIYGFLPVLFCLMMLAGYGSVPVWAADPGVSPKTRTQKIDLNHATVEELTALPGVGMKKAEAILEYRKENGPFASTDQLLKVKGIGEKLLAEIKPMITVRIKNPDLPKSTR